MDRKENKMPLATGWRKLAGGLMVFGGSELIGGLSIKLMKLGDEEIVNMVLVMGTALVAFGVISWMTSEYYKKRGI